MKAIHIVIIVAFGIAIGYVVSQMGNSVQYVSFPAAEELNKENPSKIFHVVGFLNKEKPIVYDPAKDANYCSFYAKDTVGNERFVVYHSAKPTDFERTQRIVLEGKPEGDHFEASKILSKCPSKYQDEAKAEKEGR